MNDISITASILDRSENSKAIAQQVISDLVRLLQTETLEKDSEILASQLLRIAMNHGSILSIEDLVLFKAAIRCLEGPKPRAVAAQAIHQHLINVVTTRNSKYLGFIVRRFGQSALSAVLLGSIVGVMLWISLYAATALAAKMLASECTGNAACPFMNADELRPLVLASFLGGVTSILWRLDTFEASASFNPLLLICNSMLKPAIASVFAIAVYSLIKSGVVVIAGLAIGPEKAGSVYVVWVLGFLCGFSERFASDFVGRADATISGKK